MIQSQLHTHERKLLDKREGTHPVMRALLRRAEGLELLEPGVDLDILEIKRDIPLQDGGTYPMVFRIIKRLLYPVAGYTAVRCGTGAKGCGTTCGC